MFIVQLLIVSGVGLKMSFWDKRSGFFIAALCLLFSLCILNWTVDIPQDKLAEWSRNYHSMQDIAVCLLLDVMLQVAFCIMKVRRTYGAEQSESGERCYRFLLGYPGLMLFGMIFLIQVELLGSLPGQSFGLTAGLEGLSYMLVLLLLGKGFKLLLPQEESRLELFFLIQILAGILGILCTVCGNQPL